MTARTRRTRAGFENWLGRGVVLLCALGAIACAQGALDGVHRSSGGRCLDKVGGARGYVINGQDTSSYPEVCYIADASREAFCTCTLIGDRKVLTAAHCIEGDPVPASVGFGPSENAPTDLIPIVRMDQHPQYDNEVVINDVAILEIERMPALVPMAVRSTPVAPGERVVLVGFGVSNAAAGTGSGLKRETHGTVTELKPTEFDYDSVNTNICQGDSGGPALAMGPHGWVVVGVASTVFATETGECLTGGTHMRPDAFRAFVGETRGESELPPELVTREEPQVSSDDPDDRQTTPREEADTGEAGALCTNTCPSADDGECDDGGEGSVCSLCALGSDCYDCGERAARNARN